MENASRWYFTKDELANTPSRKCGIDANKELSYRQQAANFIQDMGQRLQVTQLCINTAIVYMHRFYVFHSFSEVHRNSLSVAALFLAAKVEEQPRKLEHVIKVAHVCLHKDSPPVDVRTEAFAEKQFEVVAHENVLLQTLGFVLAIEHPHTYVVKVCQLVKASKDLAQTSYFMATTSLHMTTMCLQYRPTVVACVCIHLACKWSSWKIEPCSEGKEWYYYVDKSVTLDLLETLTQEFIAILETSPHKFKRCTKFNAQKENSSHGSKNSVEYNFKQLAAESKFSSTKRESFSPGPSTSYNLYSQAEEKFLPPKVESCVASLAPQHPSSQSSPKRNKPASHSISIDAYREKKEKERIELASTEPVAKPQAIASESEKIDKDIFSSLEQTLKEKPFKSNMDPTQSIKANHLVLRGQSPPKLSKKEVKSSSLRIPSNEPIVVLERVDAKTDKEDSKRQEMLISTSQDQKHPNKGNSKELTSAAHLLAITKSKPKLNSLHNSHSSPQSISHKLSPKKETATNGSKDVELGEKRSLDNSIDVTTEMTRQEKKDKHKSKHSSKTKSIMNHSEHSNPSIKVKIRKDIIVLPEKSQKSSTAPENPKKSLKIKIAKPPSGEASRNPVSTSIKLVITKDKSGSGSYCTSHKNAREGKKRTHSPVSQDSNKHARLDPSQAVNQNASSDGNRMLQIGTDSYPYLKPENHRNQAFYNHHFPYHNAPPAGQRGKAESNPPLPPFPPPQPPPPPE